MAKKLMILGTTSNAGKSLLVTALCRIYSRRGYKVAPFKAQNMALNSYITKEGKEMGNAQAVQAEAAGIEPDARMNPILLKPYTDATSQVIVNGDVYKDLSARDYYKERAYVFPAALKSFHELEEEYDIIFIEGAGSPAEINLRDVDIVNMGFATEVDAPCILVGDIDRGGVFASLAGTMLLFTEEEKQLIKGVLINKFRGDESILTPGIVELEKIIDRPVLGVIPHINVDIDDEDSLSSYEHLKNNAAKIKIGVVHPPRALNMHEYGVFAPFEEVSVEYIKHAREFGEYDLIIMPHLQSMEETLIYLRETGLDGRLINAHKKNVPILGVGKGYFCLFHLIDGHRGLGLIPGVAAPGSSEAIKTSIQSEYDLFNGLEVESNTVGHCELQSDMIIGDYRVLGSFDGQVGGLLLESYFSDVLAKGIVESIANKKGISRNGEDIDIFAYRNSQYEKLADAVESALDLDVIDAFLDI